MSPFQPHAHHLWQRLQRWISWLWEQEGSHGQRARGLAAGTWISNPLTYVPLYWFNYQLGSLLLGPGRGWPGLQALSQERIWELGGQVASRLLLGSTLVGAACAVGIGWLYWSWLERGAVRD